MKCLAAGSERVSWRTPLKEARLEDREASKGTHSCNTQREEGLTRDIGAGCGRSQSAGLAVESESPANFGKSAGLSPDLEAARLIPERINEGTIPEGDWFHKRATNWRQRRGILYYGLNSIERGKAAKASTLTPISTALETAGVEFLNHTGVKLKAK